MVTLEKQEFSTLGEHLALEFMERVGTSLATLIDQFCNENSAFANATIYLLAGKGNNAGDGYYCGQIMSSMGYRVLALEVAGQGALSKLCEQKREGFIENGGVTKVFDGNENLFDHRGPFLIVDALFGTGFSGKLEGLYYELVGLANAACAPIFSIDTPSGINGNDGYSQEEGEGAKAICIQASRTYYLEFPKLGFFLEQAWNYLVAVAKYKIPLFKGF